MSVFHCISQDPWYTNASMYRVYTIVKKNSTAHQSALESVKIKKAAVVPAGDSHVLVPAIKSIDFGHDVSHAKNRVRRLRMPNMQNLKVDIGGRSISIRLSARDMRTYHKVTSVTE